MMTKTRGRPREYEEQEALAGAVAVFSRKGFSGTSLDELAAAMNMNRPSIYHAFGDKQAVYRRALGFFVTHLRRAMTKLVLQDDDLPRALTNGYLAALDVYFADDPPRGCFLFCTAPTEAITYQAIHDDMVEVMNEIDAIYAERFRAAQAACQFPASADVKSAARMAQGILHTLAIRARAGESKAALKRLVKFSVASLCANPG